MKQSTIVAAISAASAILLAASCQKQDQPELRNEGKTFTAVINQDLTKTTITSDYKVNWEEGDQININGGAIFSAAPNSSDATKASFTKVSGSDPDGEYGYTAVYPASIMVETQPTLPAIQTYVAGKFNAPMYAMSDTETLEFKNFCGVLCFALKGTDKIRSITVTANEQICGPFEFADATSISFTEENKGYTVTLDCGTEGVQLNETTATNFYIYLPPCTYTAGMKMTITNTDGETFEKTTTKSAEIARSNIYTFNWTPSFASVIPAGALPGEFSVSDTKKVRFSRGNMYWDGDSFEFEDNQYSFAGSWNESHVSHFFWSKSASVTYAGTYSDSGTSTSDVFFTNATETTAKSDFTVNGVTGKYRALSLAEWEYLLKTRTTTFAKERYSNAVRGISIEGKTYNGLFLYPDDYNDDYVSSSMTWDDINAAGIVFLPAAGFRDGSSFGNVGGSGYYWSSSASSSNVVNAYREEFYSPGFNNIINDGRKYGESVRLVTDVVE